MTSPTPELPRGMRAVFERDGAGLRYRPVTDPFKQPNSLYSSPAYHLGKSFRSFVQGGFGARNMTDTPRVAETGMGAIAGLGVAGLRNWMDGGGHSPAPYAAGGGLLGWLLGGLTQRGMTKANSFLPRAMSPGQVADFIARFQDIPPATRTQMIEATYRMTPTQLNTAARLLGAIGGAGSGAALMQYYQGEGLITAALGALLGAALGFGVGNQLTSNSFSFAPAPNFGYRHTTSPQLQNLLYGP